MDFEKTLIKYLDTERILNEFFSAFDYCMKICIPGFLEKSGGRPVAACCKNRYHVICDLDHPSYILLRRKREELFGKPEEQRKPVDSVSPCEYHGPRGCLLTTHKSPICLSFMCRKSIDTLRETYGIFTYDYLGVYYALEWLLTGHLSDSSHQEFRESIETMTKTVRLVETERAKRRT